MTCCVVIVNWNSGKRLRSCVESLMTAPTEMEVVVVDNASSDDSMTAIDEFRNRLNFVRNSTNRGFAAGVNQGFASTSAPHVLILNPDVRATAVSIASLDSFLESHARAAAIGGYVNAKYLPRRIATPGSLIREDLGLGNPSSTNPSGVVRVEQPAAAALMVRRDAFDEVGGFDERFVPAWYEDVDFCRRLIAAGWEIYFDPSVRFEHEGGYSAESLGPRAFAEAYYRNQLRYAEKHFAASSRLALRLSLAAGMVLRTVARPGNAGAYLNVMTGALGRW